MPKIPDINISKSNKEHFSHVICNELALSFANINCENSQTVYSIVYPQKVWAEKGVYKATKAFFDEQKTCYSISQTCKLLVIDPLAVDEEICTYCLVDKDNNSYVTAMHEKFKTGELVVNYYKDGPKHQVLNDGDKWESQSLIYEGGKLNLDILCQNNVISNFIVKIGDKELACLELSIFAVPFRGNPIQKLKPEFINKYYITENGQCVLLRRYMGTVWETWNKDLWNGLQQSERIEEQGEYFFLYNDYIPDNFL